jgi:DNA-directed RNA polymerase III subunit RPC8
MVVFRPFASEVIIAKVKSSDQEGVRRGLLYSKLISITPKNINIVTVTVGFFDDIYVPASYLPQPGALSV